VLNTAVIVIGGDEVPAEALEELPDRRWVIAADSGLDHASRIGLGVDFLVGDMDSVDSGRLKEHRGPVDLHPVDKEATDFELALRHAVDRPNIERIIVLGGRGGRIDHFLANAAVIAGNQFSRCEIEWVAGTARIAVVRHHTQLHGTPGQAVSLLAAGGDVTGVTTAGFRWELSNEDLPFGSTRGVSNVLERPFATVQIESGCLFAIMPDPLEGSNGRSE
jgi:thiamine pyrophosphokinase